MQNVIEQHPDVVDDMLAAFQQFAAGQRRPPLEFLDPEVEPLPLPESGQVEITPEVERRLKALGYVK